MSETFDVSAEPIETQDAPPEGNTGVANTTPTFASSMWRARIARSRRYRREQMDDWRTNIDMRRGKVFQTDSDQDRIAVTYDWSATKAKQAQLFSQVPQVRLKAKNKKFAAGVTVFAKKVNDTLDGAQVGTAMDECLPDCINAAGYGLVMIGFESRQEMRDLPAKFAGAAAPVAAVPPPAPAAPVAPGPDGQPPVAPALPNASALGPDGQPVAAPPVPTLYTSSKRITIDRLSPSDGLWDLTFAGSNFNRSPWVGRSGRMHFSKAVHELNVKQADKDKVCGTGVKSVQDRLTDDAERDRFVEAEMVEFDEIFYWRYLFHDDELSFEAIQRVVFVKGMNEPTVNEHWKGQKRLNMDGVESKDGEVIIGSCVFPLQFLTLTYLTDEAIPPSDSAMGRPQIEELIQGRTDMMMQRRQSRPMRTMDIRQVPPELVTALMRGTWQGVVPVNGPGDRIFTEVARAAYPHDNDAFDRIAKADLGETWQIGGAQGFGGGANTQIRTAAEANNAQSNMNTRVGYERGRCTKFFCYIAQVVAGLLSIYGDWDDEEMQALQGLDLKHLPSYYTYSTRTDASVLVDAQQRYGRLESFLNISAKSGLVDEVPVLKEMASLIDVDEEIVARPQGGKPKDVSISLRVDIESLDDPRMVAMLMMSGQFPDDDMIEKAKAAILKSKQMPVPPPAPPMGGPAGPGGPPAPGAPDGAPPAGGSPQSAQPEDANAHWDMAGKVNKRQQDGR